MKSGRLAALSFGQTVRPVTDAAVVEDGGSDQLQQCPRCLYLLHGLATRHRCPECGLEVDRRWRVFGGRLIAASAARPMRVALAVPFAVLSGGCILCLCLLVGRPAIAFEWRIVWTAVLLMGGTAIFLIYAAYAKSNRFVAVGPDGVVVYRGPQRIDTFGWERVGRARYSLMRNTLDIDVDGRPLRLSAFSFFRGNVFAAEECVRYINTFDRPARDRTQAG